MIVVPTLVLHETFSRLDDPAVLSDTMLHAVPQEERSRWNVPDMIARAGWTEGGLRRVPPLPAGPGPVSPDLPREGGRIAAGTDAANQMLIPGYAAHREMELLVAAGLTPTEAISAATRNGALLLGVDSLGLIAPGKVADLVVLDPRPAGGHPQHPVRSSRVMSRGRMLSADSIRARW